MDYQNSARDILNNRLKKPKAGLFQVDTCLKNFALINYALPKSRLERHIPAQHFDIPEFEIGGKKMALMSVVPFYDEDFRFVNICPFLKFGFPQTNFRVYVINKKTNEHVAWFLGTTLGSPLVKISQLFWKLPWHFARYDFKCQFNAAENRFQKYNVEFTSDWCQASLEIEDTGHPIDTVEGFSSFDEMMLILTHPVEGYFFRTDGKVGTYSIWHEEMTLTKAHSKHLYFSLFEKLGLLSKEEMNSPHSIFVCPEIGFKILLPPKEQLGLRPY